MGSQLVHHLDGSDHAKHRLEVILETIAGNLTIAQACEQLGIGEAMFHRLRQRVLQVGLADLEPRQRGRPSAAPTEAEIKQQELTAEVETLEDELKLSELRYEIASILPHVRASEPEVDETEDTTSKKTSARANRKRHRRLNNWKKRRR